MLISTLPVAIIVILLFVPAGPVSLPFAILFMAYFYGTWIIDILLWLVVPHKGMDRAMYFLFAPIAPVVNILCALSWLCIRVFGRDYIE